MSQDSTNRRPVKSRSVQFFHALALRLVRWGLTPNQISVSSSVFATIASLAIVDAQKVDRASSEILLLVLALVGIQLRLVCNLIDGLMAVEGGKKTPYGELFNDLPDRISDVVLFLGAGYAIYLQGPAYAGFVQPMTLAWIAALFSVLTAYIRVLGTSMGAGTHFIGPMAKQHRMAVLNLALVGSIVEIFLRGEFGYSLFVSLWVIALGSAVTCWRRLRRIVGQMI